MRRRPLQRRSRATVEAIDEAAAMILESGDEARLTTNHIAERAGVGIGSLYEYFADKDDILRSRGEAEAERLCLELVARACADASSDERRLTLRAILAAPLSPFRARPHLAMAMIRRYGRSRWALELARRHLVALLVATGDRRSREIFGGSREQVIALLPGIVGAIANASEKREPDVTHLGMAVGLRSMPNGFLTAFFAEPGRTLDGD